MVANLTHVTGYSARTPQNHHTAAGEFTGLIQALKQLVPQADANASNDAKAADVIRFIEGASWATRDGKIDAAELARTLGISEAEARSLIAQYDRGIAMDKDGVLDQTEMAALLGTPTPGEGGNHGGGDSGGGPGGAQGGGGGSGGAQGAGGTWDFLRLMLLLMDADGDGKVSSEEAEAFLKKIAKNGQKYDKNGDGQLDRGELKAAIEDAAAAKGLNLSDAEIDSILAKAQPSLTAGATDNVPGWSASEFSKMLSGSPQTTV